ncbi:hypothetical protein STIUS_v1c06330 [Spiroplasma sp. TIUS-1]|uniref:GIY-YIG nuclease family protein n=1 Tax=Spiroplasma sp. TIUS-1 TaxID=216963 RepID=UPI0013971AEE|nr:GIY-YIG nuclease family protein [Spiroplasma sp. TIUS-1]QHX36187.1 hypothetical protein STIUS_v1c06330 [Spiroplasma sp. TIUS-1]
MKYKFAEINVAKRSNIETNRKLAIQVATDDFKTIKFLLVDKLININNYEKNVQGVYAIFSNNNEQLTFSYIGVSKNIKNRIKTHKVGLEKTKSKTYKSWLKILNINNQGIEDLYFGIILISDNEQERLKSEILNIAKVWNKFVNANKRMRDRKYHCINCGGGMTNVSFVSSDVNVMSYDIKIKCIRKHCKKQYMLK